jgi:hypothetical protein
MRGKLGWIALVGTLATTAFAGTASAHEHRDHDRRCQSGGYVEQEHHERRDRELREHQEREGQEHGWWIGHWP